LIEKLLERLDEVVQPKQKLKESAEAEFVPSPSHICNTDASG